MRVVLVLAVVLVASGSLAAAPFQNGKFQGRIAYSADGNNRDRDDLFASAVSIAMFKAFGVTNQVVHFDYNSILGEDNAEYLATHEESVRGAAKRFGLPERVIFNDSRQLEASIRSIRDAVNDSSAESPLYFVIAGPMEVPWRGISAAEPEKRKFVYCISHTVWNDLFFWDTSNRELTHHRRDLIDLGVNWVQILNQQGLGTCPEPKHGPCPQEKWALWDWMRDSSDPNVAWLYSRLKAMGRPDCSDSGMVYFLLTGNERATVQDLNDLLHGRPPRPISQRSGIRLEAENFQLENYTVPPRRQGNAVSQRMAAELVPGKDAGSIRTVFNQPYATNGRYDIDVRFLNSAEGRCELTLSVGGTQQRDPHVAGPGPGSEGWETWTVRDVSLNAGDELVVNVRAQGRRAGQLDYVQLNRRQAEEKSSDAATSRARSAVPAGSNAPAAHTPILRVALVQMAFRPTLIENRDRIVAGISDAAAKGARVVVFPERALTGSGGEATASVESAVAVISAAARDSNIYVISGAHTFLPSVKRNANWMFAIGPDGQELMRYEKLYDNHRARMPGVFLIDGIPASTAICADRWLRGVVELPIHQGSQIFFELSNNYACEWQPEYGWYWNAPLARRNSVWSILCNSGNQSPGVAPPGDHLKHGHSAIIAPDGRVVASASSDDDQVVIADIDTSQSTRAMMLARGTHPAMQPFWEAGARLQRGESIGPVNFEPLKSPAAEITLAAAPITNDIASMEAAVAEAKRRGADLVAFPARAVGEDFISRLQRAAANHQICVAVGALRRTSSGETSSAFVIGPQGEILTRYDQLSAAAPLVPGGDPRTMWFRVKGVPAVVTLEQDALWTELAELPAIAGVQIHIHLDHATDDGDDSRTDRLQSWVTCASFLTFSATVSDRDAALWEDLHAREESRAEVKGTPRPNIGVVEVMSPFSANLIERSSAGKLIVATRRVSAANPYHPARTANMNPQMRPWYEFGAALIKPTGW